MILALDKEEWNLNRDSILYTFPPIKMGIL